MASRIVGARYELLERIGSGGMATIWRARDRTLGRAVAVKLLHDNLAQDPGFVERFRAEARHAAALSHENVVAIYDTGSDDDRPYIVMELVEGPTLHDVLRSSGALSGGEAVRLGGQILSALAHAHARGLVHRDVKPGNVLITPDGIAKVTDFGIAKALDATSALTQTGTLLGTASYISPEQALGRPATTLSDLYSVGCVIYECLCGAPPFTGDNPVAVAVQHQRAPVPPLRSVHPIPAALESAIMRALSKDPAHRPQSALEMRAALTATGLPARTDQAPTVAVPPPASQPTRSVQRGPGATEVLPTAGPPRRTRIGRTLGWAAIVLLAGAVVWLAATLVNLSFSDPDAATPTPTASPATRVVRPRTPTAPPTLEPTASPTPEPTAEPEETPEPTFPLDLPGLRNGNSPGNGQGNGNSPGNGQPNGQDG